MDLELDGQRVLVTGGSKGIGLAIARAFLDEGAHVTLVARDAKRLAKAAASLPGNVTTHAADLAQDGARVALHAAFADTDILVNNAGAIKPGRLADTAMADWHDGFALKVWGYIDLSRLYAPAMMARGHGTIINIIGMGGRAVRPGYIVGAAGNAALIGFTQALGAEAGQAGARVFGINPSPTLTDRMETMFRSRARDELGDETRWRDLVAQAGFPYGRPKQPEEVAALAVMLASPKVTYLSGTVVDMDGGAQWTG